MYSHVVVIRKCHALRARRTTPKYEDVPYTILGGPEQNGTTSHLPNGGVQAADATTEAVEWCRGARATTRRQAYRRPLQLHGACKAAALPCG